MYLSYYGLKEAPFGLTPDPRFIFKTESYLEALSTIKYGIEQSKGITVVIGEVGTGKTTTLRSAIQQLHRSVLAAYIFNPFLTVSEFYEQLSNRLTLNVPAPASKSQLLDALGRLLATRHAQRLRTALIVDEAHGLPADVMEEVRLLANFETSSEKLLQVILCGQPELRTVLNRTELRQLKQRVSLRCTLKPLSLFEVNEYIRFRLKVAQAERVNLFEPEAVALIGQLSQGVPRIVNNLCDNALLYGFAGGCEMISDEIIREVAESLDLTEHEPELLSRGEFNGSIHSFF